jgi:hypothetical protein
VSSADPRKGSNASSVSSAIPLIYDLVLLETEISTLSKYQTSCILCVVEWRGVAAY